MDLVFLRGKRCTRNEPACRCQRKRSRASDQGITTAEQNFGHAYLPPVLAARSLSHHQMVGKADMP
jgi:hypothetical protein